jgi:predicted alpha/beta superfamily hydrolase
VLKYRPNAKPGSMTASIKPMILNVKLTFLLIFILSTTLSAQKTDTLSFYSKAFNSERTIYITTPGSYKYQSEDVQLPVIYLLDGQHEWFVNPALNTIRYLQYTHQIPQAIIVTIPLLNRNKECGIELQHGEELPLHKFITQEVDEKIRTYRPNNYKVLIGHSFSASFSLYSYLKAPAYYSAVIANTPLDSFRELISGLEKNEKTDKRKLFISVGGKANHEDFYHRKAFDSLKLEFPQFFRSINTYMAENTGHNAVPIVATPHFLTKLFSEFNGRFSEIALVDQDYKLLHKPGSIQEEIRKIENGSKIVNCFYPPEIAEFNGLASRYWSSDLNDYAIAVYEMAIKYYPDYYDFHLQLYELRLPADKGRAKAHLNKAYELLNTVESDLSEKQNLLYEVSQERKKNGW